MRPVLAVLVALAASLSIAACGGAAAPQTPQEAAELALKAFVDGKVDTMRAMLPTREDFLEVIEKSGEKDKAAKVDMEVVEVEAKSIRKVSEGAREAKAAGLDLATAKLGPVEVREETKNGVTALDISAKVTAGDKSGRIELDAFKVARGVVLYKRPKLEVDGDRPQPPSK